MLSGEPVSNALAADEVASLRRSFSRCRRIPLPKPAQLFDPRLLTIGLSVLALLSVGRGERGDRIAAALGASALLAGAFWLVEALSLRRKVGLAVAALGAGATAEVALAASGIAEWFAWLVPDAAQNRYVAVGGTTAVPPEELREACEWAARRDTDVRASLDGGRHLLLSASGDGARLALVLRRRASPRMVEVCESLCAEAAAPESARAGLRLVGGAGAGDVDAVVVIELNVYEEVRRNAGQLLAHRVVAEAERRLRQVFRDSDDIRRLGDDRFAVAIRVHDDDDLEAITVRVRGELSTLEVPRRIVPLAPTVVGALRRGRAGADTLERIADELLAERRVVTGRAAR
jgi:hypothetical protein